MIDADEYGVTAESFAPGEVIVDVSVHVESFVYLCWLQGSRRVYGYEASSRNFRLLQQNLGALDGVRLNQQAVWRSDDAGSGEAQAVPATSIDDILSKFDRINLLKLGCEGGEFPILLTSRLPTRVDRIVGEIHEVEEVMMTRLSPESRVDGYPVFDHSALAARLTSQGFAVTSCFSTRHCSWFEARRIGAPVSTQTS